MSSSQEENEASIKAEKPPIDSDANNNNNLDISNIHCVCGDCKQSFSNESLLVEHIHTVHLPIVKVESEECITPPKIEEKKKKSRKFPCLLCSKSFSKTYGLNRHFARAHDSVLWKCKVCNHTFQAKENLTRHLRNIHLINIFVQKGENGTPKTVDNKNYNCDICAKSFVLKSYLTNHINDVHLMKTLTKCSVCNKFFGRKSDCDKHIKLVHHNIREFECNFCKRTFGKKNTLLKHIVRKLKRLGWEQKLHRSFF